VRHCVLDVQKQRVERAHHLHFATLFRWSAGRLV
jgi:hypothetical protein